jgi:repressor LexA
VYGLLRQGGDKLTTGERLKAIRNKKGYSLRELAALAHVSHSFIADIEVGRSNPSLDTLITLAKALNVSLSSLIPTDPIPLGKTVPVPILGRIKAGIPLMSEANFEGEIEVPKDIKADFALRVSGDSMSWAGIADGDIAILKQVTSPTHGAVVAAVEEDSWEATLKFYVKANSHAVLKAANPEYKDMPITDRHRIIGQLVSLSKNPPVLNDYLAHLMYKGLADKKWEMAVEIAQQHGLDGEKVANIISAFGQIGKHVK